jgi:hypothetical protein
VALSVPVMLAVTACGATDHPQHTSESGTVGVVPVAGAPAPGSGQTVPAGLAGERLDVAVKQLQAGEGLSVSFDPEIPGKEPFRDWGVCSASPPAGHSENGHGAVVVLHIGHLKCGGGSNSPSATGSPPGAAAVKAAWHQVTEALVRLDGATACADLVAVARQQAAADGSSCQQAVRTMVGPVNRGDVRSVTRAMITSVGIQGGRATVYYDLTNGLQDLNGAVGSLNAGISFLGWSDLQRVGGKWLLEPVPA